MIKRGGYTSGQTLVNLFLTLGQVIYHAMTFDFSGMVSAFEDGVNRQVDIFQRGWNRMVDINTKGQARLSGINAKSNMDPTDSGKWGGAAFVADVAGVGKDTPVPSKTMVKKGGGKKSGAPSVLDGWRAELRAQHLQRLALRVEASATACAARRIAACAPLSSPTIRTSTRSVMLQSLSLRRARQGTRTGF